MIQPVLKFKLSWPCCFNRCVAIKIAVFLKNFQHKYYSVWIKRCFKLHKAAQIRKMWSACWSIVIGNVYLRMRYILIQLMALSIWIRKFATSLVRLHSSDVICALIRAPGGTLKWQNLKRRSSFIWKPVSAIISWSHSKRS